MWTCMQHSLYEETNFVLDSGGGENINFLYIVDICVPVFCSNVICVSFIIDE